MKPNTLPLCLALLTLAGNSGAQTAQPNVIYILADDMGYGDVSILNPEGKIPTPNLDQIAREGMVFTDAHTSSSVCTPTRYGILTGRYNWRSRLKAGVLTGKSKALIPPERTTLASMLKAQGYLTAFMGKWHLGWDWGLKDSVDNSGEGWNKGDFDAIDFTKPVKNTPNDLGFDYAYGFSGSLDMAPYVYVENGKVTAQPDTTTVNTGKYSWWREGPTGSDFRHEAVTPNLFARADSFLNTYAQSGRPFFLYLALPSPHTPILPTKEWENKSGLNPYADFVMMIDHYVGALVQTTRDLGIAQNTLIVFAADNGCSPAAGIAELQQLQHYPSYIYRGHKADIFEGGHRVPFLVKWPERIRAGGRSGQLVCTTDMLATLAEITGYVLQENEGEDSYSMLPYFDGHSEGATIREAVVMHSINGSFAIRKGDWKLILTPGSGGWSYPNPDKDRAVIDTLPPVQLYNLKDDPGETTNLESAHPELVRVLQSLLAQYIQDGRSTPGKPQQNDPIDFEWKQVDFMDR